MIVGAGEPGEKPHTYRLGGMTCLAGDVIGDYSFDRPLEIGDKLVFLDMAHYTMVKTTTFNGVRLPSIATHDPATGRITVLAPVRLSRLPRPPVLNASRRWNLEVPANDSAAGSRGTSRCVFSSRNAAFARGAARAVAHCARPVQVESSFTFGHPLLGCRRPHSSREEVNA